MQGRCETDLGVVGGILGREDACKLNDDEHSEDEAQEPPHVLVRSDRHGPDPASHEHHEVVANESDHLSVVKLEHNRDVDEHKLHDRGERQSELMR